MCLLVGGPVLATPDPDTFAKMMAIVLVQRLLARVGEIRAARSVSIWNLRRRQATNTWKGLHFARDVLQALLPKSIGGARLKFEVSGVEEAPQEAIKERDASTRPCWYVRASVLHQREGILWHAAFVLVISALTIRGIHSQIKLSAAVGEEYLSKAFWMRIISSAGFPGLSLIETVPLFLTPVIYAIFPPTMPPRRDRMVFDRESGLWRAKPECKGHKWTAAASFWLDIPHSLGAAWMLWSLWVVFCKE